MAKRNLMVADMGGSVVLVCDTLHEKYGDYVEVARIEKKTGEITWNIKQGLDEPNENKSGHKNFVGTVREVVERWSEIEKSKYQQ